MGTIRKAVIPAAGMGTRFLPATKALPKEMLPVIDTPVIQYVIEEAVASGIEDILIITGRGKRAIEDHFDQSFELERFLENRGQYDTCKQIRKIAELADIHYIRQKEPLGLGHAVLQARRHIGTEAFAVLLGDEIFRGPVPAIKQLMNMYETVQSSVLSVRQVEKSQVGSYGIIKPAGFNQGVYKVSAVVEKPTAKNAPSNLAVLGRYILEPRVFDILEKTGPGVNGEIQLTDALQQLANDHKLCAMQVQGKRFDVGNIPGYIQAIIELGLEREDLSVELRKILTGIMAVQAKDN